MTNEQPRGPVGRVEQQCSPVPSRRTVFGWRGTQVECTEKRPISWFGGCCHWFGAVNELCAPC